MGFENFVLYLARGDSQFARALLALNVFDARLDPADASGQACIPALDEAYRLLTKNRDKPPVGYVVNIDPCTKGLYAKATDDRDPRERMLICPIFFDARPECQAFVLMHEYFHLVGVIGHGVRGYGDTKPEWALGAPSSLTHLAWRLAAGVSPFCDERFPLGSMPRVRGGVVA